jgi:hypothetical protein
VVVVRWGYGGDDCWDTMRCDTYLFSRRMILSGLLRRLRRPDGALFSTSFATLFSPAGGMYEGSTSTGTPGSAAASADMIVVVIVCDVVFVGKDGL